MAFDATGATVCMMASRLWANAPGTTLPGAPSWTDYNADLPRALYEGTSMFSQRRGGDGVLNNAPPATSCPTLPSGYTPRPYIWQPENCSDGKLILVGPPGGVPRDPVAVASVNFTIEMCVKATPNASCKGAPTHG